VRECEGIAVGAGGRDGAHPRDREGEALVGCNRARVPSGIGRPRAHGLPVRDSR